jgi:hypothetical protein
LVCLAVVAVWATASRHQTVQNLRAERKALIARLSSVDSDASGAPIRDHASQDAAMPPELLQLRSEVTRLAARKRQLASAPEQNKQLRLALNAQSASTNTLPPGFVRRTQAKFAGYHSPQDTLQSFLWAMQNRDTTNMLHALAPSSAQQLQAELQRDPQASSRLFEEMQAFIGFRILDQRQTVDGSMRAKVEVAPGLPAADIQFRLTNGQWLMELPR